MLDVPKDESVIVIATGQRIGEGFDCPRLDTLMLLSAVGTAVKALRQRDSLETERSSPCFSSKGTPC